MHARDAAGLFLAASGSIILAWIVWLMWYDMTWWDKNVTLIFFGSRTGEAISLGIDIRVIHYFLTGLVLFLSSFLVSRFSRSLFLKCFTYLGEKLAHARSKVVVGVILILLLGVSLYLSPLRGDTVAMVGIFSFLSTVIVILLAVVDVELAYVGEESALKDETRKGEDYSDKVLDLCTSNTTRFFDINGTNMNLRKTDEFKMEVCSSESQATLSSKVIRVDLHEKVKTK